MIEGILTGILKTLPTSEESIDSIQASASRPCPASSAQDPEGQPSYPRGTLSESLMSVVDLDTTAPAAPEAKDAPEDRPLIDVPESQDEYLGVQAWRLSGWRLHDDVGLRLRHLFQKAGAVAEHLYMDYDVGMVGKVGILVFICIALYCLYGAIVYALRDQDMIY